MKYKLILLAFVMLVLFIEACNRGVGCPSEF